MGSMIQRCHKWRQNRKRFLDQARITSDEIERERMFQMAEHYGRMVSSEQGKIDGIRDVREKPIEPVVCDNDADDTDDLMAEVTSGGVLPDFLTN